MRKISIELIIERLELVPEKIGIDIAQWGKLCDTLLPEVFREKVEPPKEEKKKPKKKRK